jgi:hypothetical protein
MCSTNRAVAFLTFLAALILLVGSALAEDVIRFKNGRSITGRIVSESKESVTIELEGGGRLDVPRELILEVIRDVVETPEPTAGDTEGVLRSEQYFVWSGERRLGFRTIVVRKTKTGGFHLEENLVFFTEEGEEDVRVHLVEICDREFEPLEVLYRENSTLGLKTMRGLMREGRLVLVTSLPGERREGNLKPPEGMRLPLSAREIAIRGRDRVEGEWECPVFDPREENFFRFRFKSGGKRTVDWGGEAVETSILKRFRGERPVEEIWLDPAGQCLTEELNGSDLVAVRTTRERLKAFQEGNPVEASAEERRVRPVFVHPEAGFRIAKPALTWEFEPQPRAGTKALTLSNLDAFAYVDIFVLPETPEGGLLSALAVDMESRFRDRSKNFRKIDDAFVELGGGQAVRINAFSRNKGEDLRSILVGTVHGGKTWLITLACPVKYFERTRPAFEDILRSFTFID